MVVTMILRQTVQLIVGEFSDTWGMKGKTKVVDVGDLLYYYLSLIDG
jgi:hypothetical protein